MQTAIFILLCLLVFLMFAIYDKICKKEESSKTENLQTGQGNQKELEIYRQGLQQSWLHVNISLYKMWTELEILDFDSLQNKLQQTLETLASHPNEMNEWAEKFKEYMKEHGK